MPVSALLARIRKFIPQKNDRHYDEIVRGFGIGARAALPGHSDERPGAQPSDCRISQGCPSAEAVSSFGRRLDPSSGV
jgi:hypothetical protein